MRSLLTLLLLATQAGTPATSAPAAKPGAACPSLTQVEQRAREVLGEPGTPVATPYTGALAPPLPMTWPPTGAPAVRLYAFRFMPLPTGVGAYRYWSPHAVAEVPLRGKAATQQQIKPRMLGREDEKPTRPPAASMDQAIEALLQAICRGRLPSGPEAETIRSGYRAWADSYPLITQELRTQSPAFFTWLDEKPASAH